MKQNRIQTTRRSRALALAYSLSLAATAAAWGQTGAADGLPLKATPAAGSAENIFVNDSQGTGQNSDPAPVGNKKEWKKCGTYNTSGGTYLATYVSGESGGGSLHSYTNDWVMNNLAGHAPLQWANASMVTKGSYDKGGTMILSAAVAFDPRQMIRLDRDNELALFATEDNSYALPLVSLKNTSCRVTVTNPKAIASVAKLEVDMEIPQKEDKVLYANLSMPFTYDGSKSKNLPADFYTYSGKNRADKGSAGQTNWAKSDAGRNWVAVCGVSQYPTFVSASPVEALSALRGVRYGADGNEETVTLPYAYGVTGKTDDWMAAHFGWNVVNSGSIREKAVTFTDPAITAIQYLTADGGYTTLIAADGKFKMTPYTAYFVQTTNDNTKTDAQTRAAQPAAEAVVELLAADGSVADRILATAGAARPGRNVEKMGVGACNLYIDKAGMKCAATDEAGLFAVRVTGSGLTMRLASIAEGVSATWNGVPLRTGETFAASDGTLRLDGVPTSTEEIGHTPRHAWGEHGRIVIEGPADGTLYHIATTAGATLATGRLTENRQCVTVDGAGFYIVSAGGESFKVVVK